MPDTTSKGLRVPKNPAMALRELNMKHATKTTPEASETSAQEGVNTTILQTDQQTNKLTDDQTDQQTNKPILGIVDPLSDAPDYRSIAPQVALAPEIPPPTEAPPPRVDGRTLRVRQPTADMTMVTSFRLAVSTVEKLDDFCWRHRMRKQDVIQAALDHYFKAIEVAPKE
jgi:hypothetical protein